ncbi:MAG: hypothetical protein C4530_14805 [Desulfobacteraceae bacterium]|nr:MAG: hypothetical protein C4530_14805 [Desulfobacteraceae bacterium]
MRVVSRLYIKTWISAMTPCFSRHLYAELVKDQKACNYLVCQRRAFEFSTASHNYQTDPD